MMAIYKSTYDTDRAALYDIVFSQYFGNMTHTHEIGNFSGVFLKIGKKYMTVILQL